MEQLRPSEKENLTELIAFYLASGYSLKEIAETYLLFIQVVMEETKYFAEHGEYRYHSFAEVSSDVYFNHIEHDYTQGNSDFVDQLINGNEEAGQELVYLQAMGGIRTRILFPNLEHWCDTINDAHVVINEAKLVLPVAEWSVDSTFLPPTTLYLVGFSSDTTTYLLPDYYEGNTYFGGTYSSAKKAVTFRISEYMQSIITKKKSNMGLSLGINGASYSARRMIINGPEAQEENKMRLEVTYSVVNE